MDSVRSLCFWDEHTMSMINFYQEMAIVEEMLDGQNEIWFDNILIMLIE